MLKEFIPWPPPSHSVFILLFIVLKSSLLSVGVLTLCQT